MTVDASQLCNEDPHDEADYLFIRRYAGVHHLCFRAEERLATYQ